MLLHNTLACEPFRKRERHNSASVELGRSSSDLSRVTKDSSIVPVPAVLSGGTFLSIRALQRGPHLPGQCLGLHFRQQWHISIPLAIWCCTNSPRKCAVTFTTDLHNTVLLQDSKPGISTRDPPNVNALLFSAIPKNQVTNSLQTTCLQNFSKATELSVQNKSQPHALGCIGNIPLEIPSLLV